MIQWLEARLEKVADAYAPDLQFLALIRILFGLWVMVVPNDLRWIDRAPAEFFHPRPGLFQYLQAPPSELFLTGLMAVTFILGLLLVAGIGTTPVSIVLSAALITSSGISYSYSKIDHFILFEITPIFLALAGWGRAWSFDSLLSRRNGRTVRSSASGMPVMLFALTIGFAMLTAGVRKADGGWLDPERHGARGYLARDIVRGEKLGVLGPEALNIHSDLFWKALDYTTIIVEAGLILTVFTPLVFRIWLLLVIAFHVNVFLVLGINFAAYVMVYMVFYSPVYDRLCRKTQSTLSPVGEPLSRRPASGSFHQ